MAQQASPSAPDSDVLDAIGRLLDLLFQRLGPGYTLLLLAGLVLALAIRRVYYDRRADRDSKRAIEEMERTIQRLANQERAWRYIFVTKTELLSADEADLLINRNEYPTPKASREDLESHTP